MNRKGFAIPALAVLALVIFLFIIYSAHNPEVKQTTEDYLKAARGESPTGATIINIGQPPENTTANASIEKASSQLPKR